MNNEQQTWILRKPMKVEFLDDVPGGRYVTDLEIMGLHDYMWNEAQFDEEHFKAQFVPLDVSGLTRQVEELIYPFIEMSEREGYYALENPELFHELDEADSATDVIVNKLLALLGGTTNE